MDSWRRGRTFRLVLGSTLMVSWISVLLPSTVEARVAATQMSPNTVETQYGRLRGVLIPPPSALGRGSPAGSAGALPHVEAYLGIQYASLLGGELRFMPPTSTMEKWDGVRVALKFRPVCPQLVPDVDRLQRELPPERLDRVRRLLPFVDKQNEECLNLNIYVPFRDRNETAATGGDVTSLPVVVFVHGESFDIGTGNAYDGSVMAAVGHVIVVTLNYRLGVLGFLSTGDSNAPGNYALLDIVAALHWIKENIAAFGGDSDSITLLGHGYGAALVNLLTISPVTRGRNLFQRVIVHGGSALSSWSLVGDPLPYARHLADRVNCSLASSSRGGATVVAVMHAADLIHCMKQKNAEELVNFETRSSKYLSAFGPTIDRRSVLPFTIQRLMMKPIDSIFASTRMLVGLSRVDAAVYLSQRDLSDGLSADRMRRLLRTFVQNVYVFHRQYIYDVLAHQYTDWERTVAEPSARRDWMLELLGDGLFVAPSVELAQRHAALTGPGSTFLCTFNHVSRTPASGPDAINQRWSTNSMLHSEDMAYAFGAPLTDGLDPFSSTGYTRGDKTFSETVIRYWTNFIKTGNPNDPRSRPKIRGSTDAEWPAYDLETQQLMVFGARTTLGHHYRGSKMALWLELIPKLHKSDNLDPRYHQLDNWDNQTTFETNVTRLTSHQDLLSTMSTASSALPTTPTPSPSTSTTRSTTTTASHAASTAGHRRSTSTRRSTSPLPQEIQNVPQQSAAGDGGTSTNSSVSLSVTIAVGSFLLFLNIVIFVAVYYQKDRIRRERKRRKTELASIHQDALDHQLQAHHPDCCNSTAGYGGGDDMADGKMGLPCGYVDHYGGGGTSTLGRGGGLPPVPPAVPPPCGRSGSTLRNHYQPPQPYPSHHGSTMPRLSTPPKGPDGPAYGTALRPGSGAARCNGGGSWLQQQQQQRQQQAGGSPPSAYSSTPPPHSNNYDDYSNRNGGPVASRTSAVSSPVTPATSTPTAADSSTLDSPHHHQQPLDGRGSVSAGSTGGSTPRNPSTVV